MTEVSDVITLRGLSAMGQHGVYDFERSGSQVFSADLTLHVDSRRAAQTDDVQYTVDYGEIADAAVNVLTGPPVYLLETLAHNLAAMALENPQVLSVDVTIHKPMAPVRHQFTDVSVTITRDRETLLTGPRTETNPQAAASNRVVLALGSNQGASTQILTKAIAALIEMPGVEIDDVSPLVVTKPVLASDQEDQPDFLNVVVIARTVFSPAELLTVTQSIENQFGRLRTRRWGARTLDIDLIDYAQRTEQLPGLELPHPRADQRDFVLYPWSLVAPDDTLPDGRKVGDLAAGALERGGILETRVDWLIDETPEPSSESSSKFDPASTLKPRFPSKSETALEPDSKAVPQVVEKSDTDPEHQVPEVEPVVWQAPQEAEILSKSSDPIKIVTGQIPKLGARQPAVVTPTELGGAEENQLAHAASSVTIRGNRVDLVAMEGDSLFQSLLKKELTANQAATEAADKTVAETADDAVIISASETSAESTSRGSVDPGVEAFTETAGPETGVSDDPVPAQNVEASGPARLPQPDFFGPSRPRRSDRHRQVSPAGTVGASPELPDWRFVGSRRPVRIIDSVDGGFNDADGQTLETPRNGIGRRRVYRPTPTGMIPLTPIEESRVEADESEGGA